MKCKAALHLFFLFTPTLFAVPGPDLRRSCAPFVSGDGFRAYADHAHDELTTLEPADVQPNHTIFVKTDKLEDFFCNIHPHIQHPYILISHNSDNQAPGAFASFLNDPRILAWFAQNYDGTPHPKMHPIPIGIANYMWTHGNPEVLKRVQTKHLEKRYLCYLNIDISTYPQERFPLFKYLSQTSFCHRTRKLDFEKFLQHIAMSKFMVSPRGNGLDTHRLWESLYMGTIPIVKSSSLDSLYSDLPVFIVSDWISVTESTLDFIYHDFAGKIFSLEKLSMDYWTRLIDSYKTSP
ncbi:MAG: hypothetical protein KGJ02_04775 [Verrucomicrobiota bacterium]|nr:hypothetical protein [Verrucomicrobiota bacterium]